MTWRSSVGPEHCCWRRNVTILCVAATAGPIPLPRPAGQLALRGPDRSWRHSIIVSASAFRFSSLCPCCAPLTRPFIIVRVIRVAKTLSRSPDMVGKASPASACKVWVGQGGADGTKRRRAGGPCAAPPPALVGSGPELLSSEA